MDFKKQEKQLNHLKRSLYQLRNKIESLQNKEENLEQMIYLIECEITGTKPINEDEEDEEKIYYLPK